MNMPRPATQFIELRKFGNGGGVSPYYNNSGPGGYQVIDLGTVSSIADVFPPVSNNYGPVFRAYGAAGTRGVVVIHY